MQPTLSGGLQIPRSAAHGQACIICDPGFPIHLSGTLVGGMASADGSQLPSPRSNGAPEGTMFLAIPNPGGRPASNSSGQSLFAACVPCAPAAGRNSSPGPSSHAGGSASTAQVGGAGGAMFMCVKCKLLKPVSSLASGSKNTCQQDAASYKSLWDRCAKCKKLAAGVRSMTEDSMVP